MNGYLHSYICAYTYLSTLKTWYHHIELTRSHIPQSSSSSEEWRITYMPWSSLKVMMPKSTLRSTTKAGSGRAFVPISATSNLVLIGHSSAILFEQHSRKWQTRIGMCFCFLENAGLWLWQYRPDCRFVSGWRATRRRRNPSRFHRCLPARGILLTLHDTQPPLIRA